MTPPIEICYVGDCYSTSDKNPILDIQIEIGGKIQDDISIRLENKESGGGTAEITTIEKGSERKTFIDLNYGEKSDPIEYRGRPILLIGK